MDLDAAHTRPRRRILDPSLAAVFRVANFRRFACGQGVSLIGSWVDTVGQGLLVLQLTGSGLVLGLVTAARYLPVLLLTPYAGLIVDRSDKRRLLMLTAAGLAAVSVSLGLLVLGGLRVVWPLFVIALASGCLSALDNPARQAFIPELVGPGLIRSAVSVNSTVVNVGRAVGPAIAAALAASVGLAWCFLADALSFAAVLAALGALDARQLRPAPRTRHEPRQLRQGIAYALRVPWIVGPIVMMAVIGTFTYEFEVSLPLFADRALGSDELYPWLIGAFGVGSVFGGVYCALRPPQSRRILRAAAAYAIALGATALAPTVEVAVPLLLVVGFASITFLVTGNSTIQLAAPPQYRGRVSALWSTAFLGSTPIGASIIGAVGGVDARVALGVGAAACAAALVLGSVILRSHDRDLTEKQTADGERPSIAAGFNPSPRPRRSRRSPEP